MPGRLPAKKFRTVLFDILTAATKSWRQMNIFSFSNKSIRFIFSTNYTIKIRLMKTQSQISVNERIFDGLEGLAVAEISIKS